MRARDWRAPGWPGRRAGAASAGLNVAASWEVKGEWGVRALSPGLSPACRTESLQRPRWGREGQALLDGRRRLSPAAEKAPQILASGCGSVQPDKRRSPSVPPAECVCVCVCTLEGCDHVCFCLGQTCPRASQVPGHLLPGLLESQRRHSDVVCGVRVVERKTYE